MGPAGEKVPTLSSLAVERLTARPKGGSDQMPVRRTTAGSSGSADAASAGGLIKPLIVYVLLSLVAAAWSHHCASPMFGCQQVLEQVPGTLIEGAPC
jgi:hypothetical protein